jgi:hypothetical protein
MSDTDLQLKFGADASGAVAGADETAAAVKNVGGTVQALIALMLELGGASTGSWREMKAGAAEAAESVKGAAESVVKLREAVSEIGEVLIAAFAVEQLHEFAEKMGETAEKALHTAETFGLTVGEVQKMNAEAALFGVPAEAMTTAMQRLDKSFATAKQGGVQQAAAFKQLGIDLQGAYTQTQLMSAALEGLGRMEAGPAKIAAAMQLFGRNIQQIGPLLGLTTEQISEASEKIEAYGAVNEESAAKGVALAESLNENKLAGMGLNNVLTDALAPAFKAIVDGVNEMALAFIKSYESGGTAKTVLDSLAWTVKAVADVVGLFGAMAIYTFDTIDGAIWLFQSVFNPLIDVVAGACTAMIDSFKSLGDVIRDVFTLNWSAIQGDINSGSRRVAADVTATAKKMGSDAAAAFHQGAAEWAAGDKTVADYEAWSKKMWGPAAKANLPKEGTGTTADDPTKVKKAKGGATGDSELQQWEAELQDKKLASNNFWNEDLAGEVAFWQSKLAILQAETGGTRAEQNKRAGEIRAIRQKIFDDEKTLANQERSEGLTAIGEQVKTAVDGENAKYKVTMDGIRERQNAIKAAAQRGELDPQAELAALEQLNAEEVAAEKAKADAIYQINLKALQDKAALYATDPVNLKKTQDTITQLAQLHENQLTTITAKGVADRAKLEQQAATQTEQLWKQRIGGVVTSFGQQMQGLINGTATWRQAMQNLFLSIETAAFKAVERMVTNWLAGEISKTAASQGQSALRQGIELVESLFGITTKKTEAAANVGTDVALAGAGGVASMAAAPFPINLTAPAFGASMAAAAGGFGAAAVAAEGGYDIPFGINPLVQAHQQEMILPASIANPVRQMVANYQGQGGAGQGSAGTGDSHLHYHAPSISQQSSDLASQLERHASDVVRWMERSARDGKLTKVMQYAGVRG